jgi:hypothetical protein
MATSAALEALEATAAASASAFQRQQLLASDAAAPAPQHQHSGFSDNSSGLCTASLVFSVSVSSSNKCAATSATGGLCRRSSVSSGHSQASSSAKPRLLFSSSITSKLRGSDYIGGTCSAVSTCDQRIGSSSAFQQHAPRQQLGDIMQSAPRQQLGISAAASLVQPQASAPAPQQQCTAARRQ